MATFNKSTSSTTEHLQEPCWQQVPPSPPAFWASDSWRLDRFSMAFPSETGGKTAETSETPQWISMKIADFLWTWGNFYENWWISMKFGEFPWTLGNFYENWWISMKLGKLVNFYENWWISMKLGEFLWTLGNARVKFDQIRILFLRQGLKYVEVPGPVMKTRIDGEKPVSLPYPNLRNMSNGHLRYLNRRYLWGLCKGYVRV